jgi:hypothetical protein
MTKHRGSCHCGDVRFEIEADLTRASRCNCSICMKVAQTGVISKPETFTLLSDEAKLGCYEWGAKISRRYFCKRCGIHCFAKGHLAELGGDYVSVNVNCLDDVDPAMLKVVFWDGRHDNWQVGPRDTPWPLA